MIIDLLHNQIVSDTITEGFKRSVINRLAPALGAHYGDEMIGMQMYEDHLADEFLLDGVFYYPMTVILQDEQTTHWVSWPVSADEFTDLIPYSYVGEGEICFDISPAVPIDFETAIIGRSRYCESGLIKINVRSASPAPTFLAGKYSQTFIDEMARQLTVHISERMSVEGLADSGLALELEFSPVTFMEHNSENETYRRLLLTDGASAPRDFWVHWINHRANTPFTVSDHPLSDEIEFRIGEGVHQKIREREYRHLVRTNSDKYQSAMGKRNITEWKDLIKRAVKRGRLIQVARQIPLVDEVILVNAALANEAGLSTADVASNIAISYEDEMRNMDITNELAKAAGIAFDGYIDEPEEDEVTFEESDDGLEDELLALIALNKAQVANREELDSEIILGDEQSDEDYEEDDEAELDYDDADDEIEEDEIEDDETEEEIDEELEDELDETDEELDEELEDEFEEQMEIEIVELEEEIYDEPIAADEPVLEQEVSPELPTEEDLVQVAEEVIAEDTVEEAPLAEKIVEIEENTITEPENVVVSPASDEGFISTMQEIKSEISKELGERLEQIYKEKITASAESELAELRKKNEQLIIENRRLLAQAQKEQEERKRISEQRKLENDRLRAEIDARAKAEAIEKERLVEAARNAVEEKHRLERERLAEERRRLEDERRLAEDREKAAAEAKLAAERALEAERIRIAAQARAAEHPEEAAEEPQVDKYAHYTYIAKNVRLLFRGSVDPNITSRIYEILLATLEHYGKSDLHIRVRATVPDTTSFLLEFLEYPKQEMELLYEIIKVLGGSGIGIAKAILEDPKK